MSQKTKAQLTTYNTTYVITNGVRSITGLIMQTIITFLIDSFPSYLDDKSKLRKIQAKAAQTLTYTGSDLAFGFDEAFAHSGNDYALSVYCYDASGNNVDFQITNRDKYGFAIIATVDCFIDYTATEIVTI